MKKVAVIGTGNIGRSILEGLVSTGEYKLYATRRHIDELTKLSDEGISIGKDNVKATIEAKYIILAVKPFKVEEILKEISPVLNKDHVLISVASEISMNEIEKWSGKEGIPVFRAMPNTASSIKESMTCISFKNADQNEVNAVKSIFSSIGETIFIEEELMEAATILGACGIAYALRFIRAMIQGGVQIGFDAPTATKITTQTVKGAAAILLNNKTHPEAEIDKVTTPKGCTITGLNEMEHQGFSSALIKGITTSFNKIEQ